MITMTKNMEEATVVTHAGNFHADDVFGSVFLDKYLDGITLIRVKDYTDDGSRLCFDIGRGRFDHHQTGYDKKRENGIHFCGFGLLWQEYGLSYLKKIGVESPEDTFSVFDYLLVNMIDAFDNGELSIEEPYHVYTISSLIELFRPKDYSLEDEDECFLKACRFASELFDLILREAIHKVEALQIVRSKIDSIQDKILVLDKAIPYEFAIFQLGLDVNFVVFPSNRGGYASHTVPTFYRGFTPRVRFPKSWAGLRDQELARESGLSSAMFCHNKLFLFTCGTREDAIEAAKLAQKKDALGIVGPI